MDGRDKWGEAGKKNGGNWRKRDGKKKGNKEAVAETETDTEYKMQASG